MRLVHETADDERTLARDVDVADTTFARARGLTFRRGIPDGYALAFRFERAASRSVHMVFVPFPIDVVWACDGVVQRTTTLRPWIGFGRGLADTIVELPAGAADGVESGDRMRLEV